MVHKLEEKILLSWETERELYKDPYEYILDVVGKVILDPECCRNYLEQLDIIDASDAIYNGFDDLGGFAFFYLVKHLIGEKDLLARMGAV